MSNGTPLLVVDDEEELREIVAEYFGRHGFAVTTARDAAAAREAVAREVPRLAILDIHMPGEDGLSLARWLRDTHKQTGIVMLTTAADVVDRIVGLEMGADDYIAKPFDLRELLARIKSVLRRLDDRASAPQRAPQRLAFGRCELDLVSHKLFDASQTEIAITAMEYDLLKVFADNPNRVLDRDTLMELAHNRGWEVFDRSIDLRIMRLRRKIEIDPEKPEVLKTVRGAGYMFVRA
ncbi:MAG: response regulator [Moraxellaceae bacterium]|nr:response regulator [Moraxellaceae bacterium]